MTRICLNMIVKDESAIIERCLRAALPFVDTYIILDTGSTDDTIQIIEGMLGHLPGGVRRGTFENFGQARNDALLMARNAHLVFDYILLLDADMEIQGDPHALCVLGDPAYSMVQRDGLVAYSNTRLVRRNVPAKYVGVTHEYLHTRFEATPLPEAWFLDHAEGSNRADKFERDIRLLEAEVEGPDLPSARTWFYLAQSYRDAGRHVQALAAYRHRVALGGWEEEVWYSLFQVAELTGSTDDYLAAYNYRPTRVEPLVALARKCRLTGRWPLAYLFAGQATRIVRPDDVLFLDEGAYSWKSWDESSIAAYWMGLFTESAWRCEVLLREGNLPEAQRARVEGNLLYAEAATQTPREGS